MNIPCAVQTTSCAIVISNSRWLPMIQYCLCRRDYHQWTLRFVPVAYLQTCGPRCKDHRAAWLVYWLCICASLTPSIKIPFEIPSRELTTWLRSDATGLTQTESKSTRQFLQSKLSRLDNTACDTFKKAGLMYRCGRSYKEELFLEMVPR